MTQFSAAQAQEQEQERGFTAIVAKEFHRNFCLFQVSLQLCFTAQIVSLQAFVFGILPSFSRLRDLLEKVPSPILLAAFGRDLHS